MKLKPSRSFLFSLAILGVVAAGYWWGTSGQAAWRASQVRRLRAAILHEVFAPDLPASISSKFQTIVSGTAVTRIEGRLPRQEFNRLLDRTRWNEIPMSREHLSAMHLPPDTPKDYITCFSGRINGRSAKLLWSDYRETFVLNADE